MCRQMARLLPVLTVVMLLAVPAMAQPDPPKAEAEALVSQNIVALVEEVWSGGLFGIPTHAFHRHYQRHRYDRGLLDVKCPSDYLKQAMDTYRDTVNNPHKYKIVEQISKDTGEVLYKYTHLETRVFIIHNNNHKIYTFGGGYRGGQHHAKRNARRMMELTQQKD